jgi:arsenical pump membrane protein
VFVDISWLANGLWMSRLSGILTFVSFSSWLAIGIALGGIACMLLRPRGTPEWIWASGAALLLVLVRAIGVGDAWSATLRGLDVYAFLIGIMALAELARHEGLFDWLATRILDAGGGSRTRLFAFVYLFGVGVTALLSNDTTAVVLTPAIFAALARTDADPLPYLYACAFVANAASFVLPISNPANLVVFAPRLPSLHVWVAAFALSALAAIALTYLLLYLFFRGPLNRPYVVRTKPSPLPAGVALGAIAIGASTLALLLAAALRLDVGITALAGAVASAATVVWRDRGAAAFVMRHIAWQVVPLVAGLFVIVAALDHAGWLDLFRAFLLHAETLSHVKGNLLSAGLVAAASNLFNNLPVALASGIALHATPTDPSLLHAALVAVDLGPNLSVTGSLATLLWLIALRRDGFALTPLQFMRLGSLVTLPALIAAVLLVR